MSARRATAPVKTVTLPVANMRFHLHQHACGTVAYGLQSDVQAERGDTPDFCGFPDRETPAQLRALADLIEGTLA